MKDSPNRSKSSFYRRLYVAHLISIGTNTFSGLLSDTGLPRRTLQEILKQLDDLDIVIERHGVTKNKVYSISAWSSIDKDWVAENVVYVKRMAQVDN